MSSGDIFGDSADGQGAGPRIVLGLDYGTTNTELAWTQTKDNNPISFQDLPTSRVIFRNWPNAPAGDALTVPSSISYSPCSSETRQEQWGWDIALGSSVIRWTKMQLEPRTTMDELNHLLELMKGLNMIGKLQNKATTAMEYEIPRHITRSAEDIVADYLSFVARTWAMWMKGRGRNTLKEVPLDVVLLHPAKWSYEAKNKTYRAFKSAFNMDSFPTLRDIYFASEPESCALYTVQDIIAKKHDVLCEGDCFVLADAGGGTVDVVSYRVNSIDPLDLTRIGPLSVSKCGAILIDQAFLEFLHTRLENLDMNPEDIGTGGHMILKPKSKLLLDRFQKVKHAFEGTQGGQVTLPKHTKVVPGFEDSVTNNVLTLTATELADMFRESVEGTLKVIARHIGKVQTIKYKGRFSSVTNIFLAGGFSESQHLLNEVTKFANRSGGIRVQRAPDPWVGIVKGAVLLGLGIGMTIGPSIQVCPRHYGISLSQTYQEWNHLGQGVVKAKYNGNTVVLDRMLWMIRKGDCIVPDEPIVQSFRIRWLFTEAEYRAGKKVYVDFVATTYDDAPANLADIPRDSNEVCRIEVDPCLIPLEDLPRQRSVGKPDHYFDSRSYYTLSAFVEIKVFSKVDVTIKYQGKVLKTYSTKL